MKTPELAVTITNTLDVSGISRQDCIVAGGSVLGLFGLRQPYDLDVLVGQELFDELRQAGQTSRGVPLKVDTQVDPPRVHLFGPGHHLFGGVAAPDGCLALHVKALSIEQSPGIVEETTEYDPFGLGIRHFKLGEVLRRKAFSDRPSQADYMKDQRDAELIAAYLLS